MGRNLLVSVAILVLWLGWPIGALVYRVLIADNDLTTVPERPSVTTGQPEREVSWTVDEALAALDAGPIARLDGAPAVIDETRILDTLEGTGKHVLLLPYAGVTTREAASDRVRELRDARPGDDSDLVVVHGLAVKPDLGLVVPSTIAEAERVLASGDVTEFLISAITDEYGDAGPAPPAPVPADPAQVNEIAAALETDQVYTAPGLEPVTATDRWREVMPGYPARIAALPFDATGTDLTDQLAQRFPGDLVIVVRGLWVEFAGPPADLRRIMVTGYYGEHFSQLAEWGPAPVNLALAMATELGTLQANRDVVLSPRQGADPLPFVVTGLPWIFAGTVGVVVVVTFLVRRRGTTRHRDRERADQLRRDRVAAAVTATAGAIAHLDGLARDGRAKELVDRASERYLVGRDLVAGDGDLATAEAALDEAAADLDQAGALLTGDRT